MLLKEDAATRLIPVHDRHLPVHHRFIGLCEPHEIDAVCKVFDLYLLGC
jgi:hypothetical protein